MKKKYKALIYIVACLSGSAMGVAIASSGYVGLLYNWFNSFSGSSGDSSRLAPAL